MKKQEILKELIEKLADLEHQQWSHWTRYFLDNLNPTNKCKWVFQLETPYSELSEKEKESDRKWARKVLEIVSESLDKIQTKWESCNEK